MLPIDTFPERPLVPEGGDAGEQVSGGADKQGEVQGYAGEDWKHLVIDFIVVV